MTFIYLSWLGISIFIHPICPESPCPTVRKYTAVFKKGNNLECWQVTSRLGAFEHDNLSCHDIQISNSSCYPNVIVTNVNYWFLINSSRKT